jgi:hypothetical protein
MAADYRTDNLPSPFNRHLTAQLMQLTFVHRQDQITFAGGFPIQSISSIKKHFRRQRATIGAL